MDSVIIQWPERATLYGCPIPDCKWTHTAPHPTVYEGGATIEESVTNTLRVHYADIESALRAHLETHSLVEWVREVMRLRSELAMIQDSAAVPDLVTVGAGDLETVLAMFSPRTRSEDESAQRLRAVLELAGEERR